MGYFVKVILLNCEKNFMSLFLHILFYFILFLADRTNGRAIGTVFRLSVCRLSVEVVSRSRQPLRYI